jgi:hypothetical protein
LLAGIKPLDHARHTSDERQLRSFRCRTLGQIC